MKQQLQAFGMSLVFVAIGAGILLLRDLSVLQTLGSAVSGSAFTLAAMILFTLILVAAIQQAVYWAVIRRSGSKEIS